MTQMSNYKINEKDIEQAVHYLELHDPKNADREYAMQLLITMQEIAEELVDKDITTAALLELALKKKQSGK